MEVSLPEEKLETDTDRKKPTGSTTGISQCKFAFIDSTIENNILSGTSASNKSFRWHRHHRSRAHHQLPRRDDWGAQAAGL
jgi:hypothetical protein